MINLIPQERLETMERKLMEEIVTEKDSRIREAGDLRSAVESLHEHIEHVKVDTSTTLDAWEQKLALACFDAVKSMQAWFSDVEENGQARFHELEEGQVSTKSALRSMHSRLSDFGSWQNQRDEARTHQFQCIVARLDELRSDSSSTSSISTSPESSKRAPVSPSRLWTKKWVSKQPLVSILSNQCKPGPPTL